MARKVTCICILDIINKTILLTKKFILQRKIQIVGVKLNFTQEVKDQASESGDLGRWENTKSSKMTLWVFPKILGKHLEVLRCVDKRTRGIGWEGR